MRSPLMRKPVTGASRCTATPFRAASSAYPIVRRSGSTIPSPGTWRAARADGVSIGSSARARSPVTISASQRLARAPARSSSRRASSSAVRATARLPIRRNGVSSEAQSASQPGLDRVTSSASSEPGGQSAPHVAMPVLPFDAPSPTSPAASTSATRAVVNESRRAIAHPTTPPPTITTS